MTRLPPRSMGPTEIRAAFVELVPRGLMAAIATRIVREYRNSHRLSMARFEAYERHDIHAILRRGAIEGAVRAAAREFSEVKAEVKRNAGKTSYYTEVRVGPFVFTQSAVEHRDDMPADAVYRTALASSQLSLFGLEAASDPDGSIWGVILHGKRSRCETSPEFLLIGFPTQDCKRYETYIPLDEELTLARVRVFSEEDSAAAVTTSIVDEERVADDLPLAVKPAQAQQKRNANGTAGEEEE